MTNALSRLSTTNRIIKRAQYEAFEFTLATGGVRVRNGSHATPGDHEYLVRIEAGIPASCGCPADEHYEWACKHRFAVAIRTPVLTAATTRPVADGGSLSEDSSAERRETEPDDQECDCEGLAEAFPCWECVRTGRRELPE